MLHIVNKSPTQARSLESCLRMTQPGQVDQVAFLVGLVGAAIDFDAHLLSPQVVKSVLWSGAQSQEFGVPCSATRSTKPP
jgi:hypothetical protein